MKKLLGSLLLIATVGFSYAEGEAPQKGKMLEEAKAQTIKMIDMRIKALQESKTCVSNAKSKEDMHKCRELAHKDVEEFKGARDENRKEWKGKREEWKAKRGEWKEKRKEMRGGPRGGGPRGDGPEGEDGPPPPPEGENE